MNKIKKWEWCKTFHIWIYNRWFWRMYRAWRDLFKSIGGIIFNFFAIIFIFFELLIEIILRPLSDIFQLGYPYKEDIK